MTSSASSTAEAARSDRRPGRRTRRPAPVAAALVVVVALAAFAGLLIGPGEATAAQVLHTLVTWDSSVATDTVLFSRLPRIALAAAIGAALGVSGAIMQLVTGNPLASPQTLGINAAAALAMVAALAGSIDAGPVPALLGAAVGGLFVTALSFTRPRGPIPLALAGLSVHLLCTALIQAISVLNDATVDVAFWLNGSVAGAQWSDVVWVAPVAAVVLLATVVFSGPLQTLSLGRDVATSLGQPFVRTALLATLAVVALSGVCVSVAGPIGFVGLIVPHVVRALVGRSPRWEFGLCALAGAALLIAADVLARLVSWPGEAPVGVITGVVGAPVFLLLARRAVRAGSARGVRS